MQFHLGRAGDLRELPIVERTEDVDATPIEHEALQISLVGRVTKDVLGHPRGKWRIDWRYLTAAQLATLTALRAGRLGSPLRLVDPDRPNLLHPQLATGGSQQQDTDGWLATYGTLAWVPITDPPAGVLAHGAISWVRALTTAGDLAPGREGVEYRAPVRGVESMRFSAWIRATSGTFTAAFGVDHFDVAGSVTTVVGSAAAVPTSWTELAYTWTPTAGRVEAAPVLRIAAGQPAGTVQITGAMAVYGTDALAWHEGGGAPVVLIEKLTEDRPSLGQYDVTLTLLEA